MDTQTCDSQIHTVTENLSHRQGPSRRWVSKGKQEPESAVATRSHVRANQQRNVQSVQSSAQYSALLVPSHHAPPLGSVNGQNHSAHPNQSTKSRGNVYPTGHIDSTGYARPQTEGQHHGPPTQLGYASHQVPHPHRVQEPARNPAFLSQQIQEPGHGVPGHNNAIPQSNAHYLHPLALQQGYQPQGIANQTPNGHMNGHVQMSNAYPSLPLGLYTSTSQPSTNRSSLGTDRSQRSPPPPHPSKYR